MDKYIVDAVEALDIIVDFLPPQKKKKYSGI
jgi:hypothetical protein